MVFVIKIVQRCGSRVVIGTTLRSQFCTTAAVYQQPAANRSSTRILSKAISLRNCQSSPHSSAIEAVNHTMDITSSEHRPLVVLLTWLAAQEKHIEKYRNLYLQRGFDVLTVKTSPWDLLLPAVGARKIAQNCVMTLQKELPQYPSVILHAFSVGAYQFGEMLLEMQKQKNNNNNNNNNDHSDKENVEKLEQRIKGIVFDSVVAFEELSMGVSRSIAANPFVYKLLKSAIDGHLKLNYGIATKYYLAASDAAWNNYMRVPALILVSKNDRIGTASANGRLRNLWSNLGIDVTWQCWDKSEHVQHLPRHTREYEDIIDRFLSKVNINTNMIKY